METMHAHRRPSHICSATSEKNEKKIWRTHTHKHDKENYYNNIHRVFAIIKSWSTRCNIWTTQTDNTDLVQHKYRKVLFKH